MSVTGIISNISRCSLHDGPGVRTVVYFKGCALRCRWCHNPETLSSAAEVLYAKTKCIKCGRCVQLCPEHHLIERDEMVLLREGCKGCGKCAQACPSGALEMSGRAMNADEVMKEIRKDLHFYRASGGGVTLSGGECLLQAGFAEEILRLCHEEQIDTAVESALFVPWENVQKVLPYCDLFMTDVKLPDSERHRQYTGQDNGLIMENLMRLTEAAPGRVLARIPLIPGVNDSDEDMRRFAAILKPVKEGLRGIELLKYNALAEGKYLIAGKQYEAFGDGPQGDEKVNRLAEILSAELEGLSVYG